MKLVQRFVQHFLIVAILLATVGFKGYSHYCSITKERTFYFFSQPDCCCGDPSANDGFKDTCCENQFAYYRTGFQNLEKDNESPAKVFKHLPVKQDAVFFQVYTKPLTLAKEPYYTSPPPRSGRAIGILNQIFII